MFTNDPEAYIPPDMTFGKWWELLSKFRYGITYDIANKIKESNNDEDNNERNEFTRKSGEFTNRKGNVSKVNSLKLSGDTKKINYLKLNIAKKENSKENENEMVLRVTQTIPIDFIQRSTKKTKLPK